jgi:subtilisin-like proprotein convertase family protein
MLKNFIHRLGWVFLATIAGVAMAESHKLHVNDPALAKSFIAQGSRLIADYGSFQLLESDSLPTEGAGSTGVQLEDDLNFVQLNARVLDTRKPEAQASRRPVAPFAGRRLHLVHFAGPIKPEWIAALERSGVQIVSYIPRDAYLVYGDAGALARMQSWARATTCVQWDGDYASEYKIHPRARLTGRGSNPRNPGTDRFAVQLVDDTNANPATLALIDQMKLEPVENEFRTLHYLNVIVRLPPARLDRIAAQPEVVSIQPYLNRRKMDERQDQIVAGNLTGNSPTGPGYLSWLAGKGFSQSQFDESDFVVDISDSGLDNGTNSPGHFGLYVLGDPGEGSRVVYNRLEGSPNYGSTLQGCDGHGNLNAHIVGGYCAFNGFPFTDSAGFEYGLGVCPFVQLGSSVIFDPDFFTFPNYPNLQSDAYHNGARISANSWGAWYADGAYDVDAQSYDALVRDAQPSGSSFATPGNQQMVIVFAAGNTGPGAQTVESPGSAKNVITVGASESVRSLSTANGGNDPSGNDGCNTSDSQADNAGDMASYSGRGPCSDGRMKPDIVAPGTHVTAGVAQNSPPATNGTGSAISCFNASEIAALPGGGGCGTPFAGNTNNFFPLGQQFYTVSSGTSHATPAVAGACALLRQYFINHSLAPPSPAMTKACLINSARYLNGDGANDTLWSTSQGMGALNLGMAFDGVPRMVHDQVFGEKFTATGQTRLFTGTITDPTKPFRVTLAWTDAPGNTTGNAYNNDLDLTVTVGGIAYKGNVFSGALSVTGGLYDKENNVESVFLPAGFSGNFAVSVAAANINSDGVPNEAPSLDQDFALVVYNAAEAPAPVLVLDSSAITAENCNPPNTVIDPYETVTVSFAFKNVGAVNTTNLVATLLSTNGVAWPGGPQTYGTLVAGGSAVTQAFSFIAVGACGGTVAPVLQLQDGAVSPGALSCSFTLGAPVLSIQTATNAGNIQVPASGLTGKASPYPSTMTVSGLTGAVSKVTVTLVGLTHSYPADVDVLLVGPAGTNVVLMSGCGGADSVSGLTLKFDDGAASSLPQWTPITSGTWKPTDFSAGSVNFPSPAPIGPFGQTLSALNGLNPNGSWSLYVQDQGPDTGNIAQGWLLSITTSNLVCCSGAALPPPQFQSISLSNGIGTMSWSALQGRAYRLQSTTNLSGTNWINLSPDVTATNSTASKSDSNNPAMRRFYRVMALP